MKRKDISTNNEISDLISLSLNGYEQKILIEGKSRTLPVVITLHGGPGTPIPFRLDVEDYSQSLLTILLWCSGTN